MKYHVYEADQNGTRKQILIFADEFSGNIEEYFVHGCKNFQHIGDVTISGDAVDKIDSVLIAE